MKESDKARIFSEYVDKMIEGHGEVPEELGEMMAIAAWLMERQDGPSPTFRSRLEVKLRQQWAVVHRKPSRRWPWLPPLWPERAAIKRWVLGGALMRAALVTTAIAFILGGSILALSPNARAMVADVVQPLGTKLMTILELTGVRGAKKILVHELNGYKSRHVSLAEAQAQVDFEILLPSYLPPDLKLEGVQVFDSYVSLLYYPPKISLTTGYKYLNIRQYRVGERGTERLGVLTGGGEEITVAGMPALLMEDFIETGMCRLIWERGDLVFDILGALPKTEMLKVAESMFEGSKGSIHRMCNQVAGKSKWKGGEWR